MGGRGVGGGGEGDVDSVKILCDSQDWRKRAPFSGWVVPEPVKLLLSSVTIGPETRHIVQWWGLSVFYGAVKTVLIGWQRGRVGLVAPPLTPSGHRMRRV